MPLGNVGDDINEYIWPHYIKNVDDDNENLIVGIGSLLNHHIPEAKKYTIISSGIGYGKLPKINDSWTFLAVRGEHSKKAFDLPDDVVLLDGAYLLKDCYERPNVKITHKFGYIPHVASLDYGDWEKVCELAGIRFVDPRLGLDDFMKELCSCQKILTEAMHGAIIADCYSVPWKPVKAYHHINTKKWDDWLSAFGNTAKFSHVTPVWYDIEIPRGRVLKNTIKKFIFSIYPNFNLTPPIYPESDDHVYKKAAGELKALTEKDFYLNDESAINKKIRLLKCRVKKYFG
jgi:succinoglycan biosynthesis protein ExoV